MKFITGRFSTEPHVNARKIVAVLRHHAMKTQEGIVEFHSILTSAPNGNCQIHEPAAFSLGTIFGFRQGRMLGRIRSQCGRSCEEKRLFLGCVQSATNYFTY
jgi:hypothetical protein